MSNPQRKIVEDAPQMRSVSLSSASPMPMMPRAAPLARKVATQPYYTTGSSSPLVGSAPLMVNKNLKPSFNVVTLPCLPPMYFLERTHVCIRDATPQQVASRIAECLQKESIATKFNESEAMVEAESCDNVQFAVRVWDNHGEIIVEVQRSCGCSFSFHQLAKCILRASKGLPAAQPPTRRFTIPACVPRESDEERKQSIEEGLDIARSLLKKDAIDSKLMGFESLIHLTKVCNSKGYTAECVLGNADLVRDLLSHIDAPMLNERSVDDIERNHEILMRRNSLTVVANCLDSLKQHSKLHKIIDAHHDSLLSDHFISALIQQVSSADKFPHEACQAIRCLQTLTDASADAKRLFLECNAQSVVVAAHEEGQCRHAMLGELSRQLSVSMTASRD